MNIVNDIVGLHGVFIQGPDFIFHAVADKILVVDLYPYAVTRLVPTEAAPVLMFAGRVSVWSGAKVLMTAA